MGKFIPNDNTWVGFATTVADLEAPTSAEVTGAKDLTHYLTGLNASATGNSVPTPSFDTLFETSIVGTSQGQLSIDCYRDDTTDLAWETLPRLAKGVFIISRYGGKPATGDKCECWPAQVLSRSNANMANNSVATFTATCSVPQEPAEDATVA